MTRSMPHFAVPHLSDEAVAAYADGVLVGGPCARAQQHLRDCAECAAAVADQQAARRALRSAAAPLVPGRLLARLRELPSSAPLGGQPMIAALSDEGYPAFAAFDSRKPPSDPAPREMTTGPLSLGQRSGTALANAALANTGLNGARLTGTPMAPKSAPLVDPPRRVLPGLGISAAAAAAVIVGVLASTASAAGGANSSPARPAVNEPSPRSVYGGGVGSPVPILNVIGP